MELRYIGKKTVADILKHTAPVKVAGVMPHNQDGNMLIQGDNAGVMKTLLNEYRLSGKIDLVYIDPPFATNSVFRHNELRTAHISSSLADSVAYSDTLLGAEYLEFLRERLVFLRELMSNE